MPKGQLSKEEKAEVATRKRHKVINDQLRSSRGTTVSVGSGIPESTAKMSSFIRQSAGRTNGKDNAKAIMARKIAGVAKGIIYEADGETVKYDFSKEMED